MGTVCGVEVTAPCVASAGVGAAKLGVLGRKYFKKKEAGGNGAVNNEEPLPTKPRSRPLISKGASNRVLLPPIV